jgi:hypothetical protein
VFYIRLVLLCNDNLVGVLHSTVGYQVNCYTDKNEKEEFFSEELFTINKEIFPYCQGIIFLPHPWGTIYLKESLPYNRGNISLI